MAQKSFSQRIAAGTLAAASVAGLAGCDTGTDKPAAGPGYSHSASANSRTNMYNVLSNFQFNGQDGQPVNMSALQTSLQNSQTTLTFGFAECENYCPMINNVLGTLGNVNPNLTSIVIAANPEVDGATPENREKFRQRLKADGVDHNVVILYPTENGRLSNNAVPDVAMGTGAIVNASSPLDHSAKVVLYAPGGERLADKAGTRPASEFSSEWAPLLNSRGR